MNFNLHFIGIGAQKAGTTTLHHLLAQHPQVFLPSIKETHYFSLFYDKGAAWYEHQFVESKPNQYCGEITPYYLFHPQAPERIFNFNPHVKIIILLRNPVKRAISQYYHSFRLGFESLDIEAAFKAERLRLNGAEAQLLNGNTRHLSHQEHSYLSRSRYDEQIIRYQHYFNQDQIIVRKSEDLYSQPAVFWHSLLRDMGLDDIPLPSLNVNKNSGRDEFNSLAKDRQLALTKDLLSQLQPCYEWIRHHYGLDWE